ncbi:hypothetical protein SSX86_003852 [Deinandra increscens subsp. villosa]|uniref:SWIM-type domain-containing protein n=1 Tax=Deinandra increscens subsp. villosa TaxID=3103831 RepID=A0AAP0DM39_9ASTR
MHDSIDGVESCNTFYEDDHDIDTDNINQTNADQSSSHVYANQDSTLPLSTPVKSNNLVVLDSADNPEANQEESICSNFYDSPNGTRYWIPSVPSESKPKMHMKFDSWENAYAFYEAYAEQAGFSTKLAQSKKQKKTGKVTMRYLSCSRGAKPTSKEKNEVDSTEISPTRLTSFKRTDCKAIMKIRVVKNTTQWEVFKFNEVHNHGLLSQDNLDFLRKRRKLTFCEQEFINKCRLARIGPTKAHTLQVALKGGHHNVRGTKNDFKNWSRDNNGYIGKRDAQMFVDKMLERSKNLENFSFNYLAHDKKIRCLFWADGVSKRNYNVFGDVIAFDATYDTNLYKMVFVPFTGIDHHKKCVTFGAGLLSAETTECYSWLLEKFLEAHHGKQPTIILTDQDPAMKAAVKAVFDDTVHRLCTWHITQKLPLKVGHLNYMNKFHKLVWNVYIKPETFEERWKSLMERYNLQDHNWLGKMYQKRRKWVPGYFRHLPMCCLMKTTSVCESTNHLFKVNSSPTNNLVQFLLCFDSILDGQRYQQRSLEVRTEATVPKFKCESVIERHAARIYTRDVFKDVQNEISCSEKTCYIAERNTVDGIHRFQVCHQDVTLDILNEFTVSFDKSDRTITCSCMGFKRIGYLCRHAFCVFRHHKVYEIPDQYITPRWTRNVLPSSVFSIANRYGIDQSKNGILRHRVLDNIQQCVDRLRSDEERLLLLDKEVQMIKDKIFNELPIDASSNSKRDVIQELNSINDPQEVDLEPPPGIRNKGSGTAKRLRGPGEKAIEIIDKPLKNCNYCKQKVRNHDSRNCPKRKADLEELKKLKECQLKKKAKTNDEVSEDTPGDSTEDTSDEDFCG